MITTPLELANCDRCKAYVFQCHVGGMRAIVDMGAIAFGEIRARLIMGRTVYRQVPGRKLARFGRDSTQAVGDRYMVDHWCGTGVVGAKKVPTDTPVGPPSAPATPSPAPGRRDAKDHGSQGRTAVLDHSNPAGSSKSPPSRAPNATNRHIKPTRCNVCRELITADTKNVWAIEHGGRLTYGEHDSCPDAKSVH